jgi:hypothetical protein
VFIGWWQLNEGGRVDGMKWDCILSKLRVSTAFLPKSSNAARKVLMISIQKRKTKNPGGKKREKKEEFHSI